MYEKIKIAQRIRIFFWAVFIFILLFLIWKKVVPNGQISYVYNFDNNNHEFIGKLNPKTRVKKISNGQQLIIGNPVYFTLRVPRKFKTANLHLKYKNPNSKKYPIVEVGMLVDNTLWRYNLKAVQNSIIDDLASKWNVLFDNDAFLLQKNNKFLSFEEFFDSNIDYNKVAVYDYDFKPNFILPEYNPNFQKKKINYGLRGNFQFFTYIKKEKLNFKFCLHDLNQNKDKDDVNINLYYKDKLIDTSKLVDDGNLSDNGIMGNERCVKLETDNLPEGVYKVEMRVNDDIVVDSIETSQQKIAFLNRVRLSDSSKVRNLYTDADKINIKIINPANLQDVDFDNNFFKIDKTYKQFNLTSSSSNKIKKINLQSNGVIINGNGVFVFNKNYYFNPQIKKLDKNINLNKQGIKYILTKYKPNKINGGWIDTNTKFNLNDVYSKNNKYKFIISIPGLRADDGNKDYLLLSEIRVDLKD